MIILALGSNESASFGTPTQALGNALKELEVSGIQVRRTSNIYNTRADTYGPQPDFLNAIITIETPMPASSLLRVLKKIEAQAGRQGTKTMLRPQHTRPRPLDLDIINYKGRVCNWTKGAAGPRPRLVLPHPRAHERAYVLRPLAEAAPEWHHPVFGLTAAQLLKRPLARDTGKITGCFGPLR